MTPTLALLNFYIFVCLVCLIYQVTHKDMMLFSHSIFRTKIYKRASYDEREN